MVLHPAVCDDGAQRGTVRKDARDESSSVLFSRQQRATTLLPFFWPSLARVVAGGGPLNASPQPYSLSLSQSLYNSDLQTLTPATQRHATLELPQANKGTQPSNLHRFLDAAAARLSRKTGRRPPCK